MAIKTQILGTYSDNSGECRVGFRYNDTDNSLLGIGGINNTNRRIRIKAGPASRVLDPGESIYVTSGTRGIQVLNRVGFKKLSTSFQITSI